MKYPPIPSTCSMPPSCQDGDRAGRHHIVARFTPVSIAGERKPGQHHGMAQESTPGAVAAWNEVERGGTGWNEVERLNIEFHCQEPPDSNAVLNARRDGGVTGCRATGSGRDSP